MSDDNVISPNVADVFAPDNRGSGVPLISWSLLGMGVFVAWLCCMYLPGLFMAPFAANGTRTLVDIALRAGEVAALTAVAIFWRQIGPLSSRRTICLASIAVSSVGTAICPVIAATLGSGTLVFVSGFAACAAGSVVFLLWAEAYSQLGSTRLVLFSALSCVLAGAVSLVVANMNYTASCVATALLPAISGALALVSLSRLPGEVATEPPQSKAQLPWKLIILMALAGLASGFAGNLLLGVDGLGALHRIMATTLFGIVVLVLLVAMQERFDMRLLARITLPIAVGAFVAIPIFGILTV